MKFTYKTIYFVRFNSLLFCSKLLDFTTFPVFSSISNSLIFSELQFNFNLLLILLLNIQINFVLLQCQRTTNNI